jgi:hypothetical protein
VPLRVYHPPENLRLGEPSEKYFTASTGQKIERERALRQAKSCQGNSLPEGEIIAIIIVIELGFIGIIIIITSTIITSPYLTRVNSTNVLDDGLRIGEIGRRMNSKVKLVEIGVYRK